MSTSNKRKTYKIYPSITTGSNVRKTDKEYVSTATTSNERKMDNVYDSTATTSNETKTYKILAKTATNSNERKMDKVYASTAITSNERKADKVNASTATTSNERKTYKVYAGTATTSNERKMDKVYATTGSTSDKRKADKVYASTVTTSDKRKKDKVYEYVGIKTSCSNPEYAKDMSFKTRYEYDDVFSALFSETVPPMRSQKEEIKEDTVPHNLQDQDGYHGNGPSPCPKPEKETLKFTPWRQRNELGLPETPIRSQTEEIMEDTEPHNLLQDQAGYLGNGPAPYPRQEFIPRQQTFFNALPEYETFRQYIVWGIPVPVIRSQFGFLAGRLILYSYIDVVYLIRITPVTVLVPHVEENVRISMEFLNKPLNTARECMLHHKEWCCEDGNKCVFQEAEKM